jgi:hypothetical protein
MSQLGPDPGATRNPPSYLVFEDDALGWYSGPDSSCRTSLETTS